MANKDAFDDRRRAQEEDYFRKKEQELVEQMRARAAAQQQRAEIGEAAGVADTAVLQSLQELGFTRETVTLLHLVPLVHVAWIDGGVTARERELILEAAAARGVTEGTPAYAKLVEWLDRRPSEDFFDETIGVIKVLMKGQSDAGTTPHDLVELCMRVAGASGGILGFGQKVSDQERALIERIGAAFSETKPEATQQVVDEVE
jgi:hypothetical protein